MRRKFTIGAGVVLLLACFAPFAYGNVTVGQVIALIRQEVFGALRAPIKVTSAPSDGQVLTYDSATNSWGASSAAALGGGDVAVITTNTTLDSTYAGKLIVVSGASAVVTLTLPTSVANAGPYTVARNDATYAVRLKANTGDDIQLGAAGKCATAGYWQADVVGAHITVKAIDGTTWWSIGADGNWSPGS